MFSRFSKANLVHQGTRGPLLCEDIHNTLGLLQSLSPADLWLESKVNAAALWLILILPMTEEGT